jgi:soluble lytic murein transglycosylase-like protein
MECAQGLARFAALAVFGLSVCVGYAEARTRILILGEADTAHYAAAYAAISAGDWPALEHALLSVEDRSLVANLEAQRFTRDPGLDYGVAREWLGRNRDLPAAHAALAAIRAARPAGAPPPPALAPLRSRPMPGVRGRIEGDTAAARAAIEAVQQHLAFGRLQDAVDAASVVRSGPRSGEADWLIGLAAFAAGDHRHALDAFLRAGTWTGWDWWGRAATHYWAGRAALAIGDRAALSHFVAAAAFPTTFYGQLAEIQLGRDSALDFNVAPLDPETIRGLIERHPAAYRAAALAQLGRLSDVEIELRALHAALSPADDALFLAFAEALAAPAAQLRASEHSHGAAAAGHCPVAAFAPEGGYRLDRALIKAVTRQESRFSPIAVSTSNARGLMQLLPSTANYVEPGNGFRAAPKGLHEPDVNLRLGQSYLEYLMREFAWGGDLGKTLAAYNGGPGWLSRWLEDTPPTDDPLLFLEILPRAESRIYVERVLAFLALCRKRFGQEPAELAALASGRPAIYSSQERGRIASR